MSLPAIEIKNLSKEYRLGVIGHGTLYRDLQSWWARIRRKTDPNSTVDQYQRKRGDRFWAIKDISFDVQPGERLGIIGANGAGKSTLLKILSRVTTPTSGCARIRGRVSSLLEVGTGFHPELTGRENVYLNGTLLGMTRAEVERKFDEIVEFSGVPDYIDTPVKRYSSGMRVRLAFAVAAHLEPDILIVDEVLAVGDADFQRRCIGKMEEVSKDEGRTVLFVSHNMDAVNSLCNRAILLSEGMIQSEGEPEAITQEYLKLALVEMDTERLKGKRVSVVGARILDLEGNPTRSLGLLQGCIVELELQCIIQECPAQIKFNLTDGFVAGFTANMPLEGNKVVLKKGTQRLQCRIPELRLLPRDYVVSVTIMDPRTRDRLIPGGNACAFQIRGEPAELGLDAVHSRSVHPRLDRYQWSFHEKVFGPKQ